jgi:photosystem II stability/assembly factor-like uncharacterized protein
MLAHIWFASRLQRICWLLGFFLLTCVPVVAGIATWQSMGPPGGTITSIAVCPSDSNVVLAGTGGAGVLRSTDGGASWAFSNAGIINRSISGLKFSRSNPSIVYMATQYGVCKSTDAGATWITFASEPLDQSSLLSIDVAPTDPDVVYVGNYSGIYKTTNGGSSWQELTSPLFAEIDAVLIDRSNTNTVFAANYQWIFKSTDGGLNWARSTTGLTYARWFSCLDSRADGGILYAGSLRGGILRSTDGGGSWVSLANMMVNTFVAAMAVDPQSGAVYAANYSAGISKSTDNGQTWTVHTQGLTSVDFIALAIDSTHPANLYSSTWGELYKSTDSAASWTSLSPRFAAHVVRDVVIDARTDTTKIYVGTAGGVYKTTDEGQTWTNAGEGLGNKRVTALQLGTSDGILYAATQGGFYRTTDSGSTWVGLNTGLASTILYDLAGVPGTPGTFYAAAQGGVFQTTDGGLNWTRVGLNGAYVFLLTVDPQQPDRLYAFGYLYPQGYGLFRTTDGGQTWEVVTLPVAQPYVTSLAVDPSQSDTIYAVVSGSGVLKSTDGGTSWKEANTGQPYGYGYIMVDPRDPAVLYLGTWGRVYKSEDRAEHWVGLGNMFSDSQVSVIVPYGDKEICVGTTSGIFASDASSIFRALFPYCRHSGQELTGFAVSNPSDQTASLEIRLFSQDGQLVEAPRNPIQGSLAGKQQSALLANEIFGFPADAEVSGWAELTSSIPLSGFFQVVGQGLDGAVAFTKSLKDFCFTRILHGPDAFRNTAASSSLQIANPGTDPVTVELRLMSMAGTTVAEKTLEIPAHGSRNGALNDLFALPADFRVGFILGKVTKGEGIIGFDWIRLGGEETMIGLNATDASALQKLYSGQMAAGPGVFSSFRLVNMSTAARQVTLYAIDEAGALLVNPVVVDVPALSAIERDAGELFGFAASSLVVGSFRVESDGPGLVGDVVFGEPEKLTLAAAMPLQDELFRRVVFSQVANGMGLFTGLAFHVPGTESATVSIQVYSADGENTGETQFVMPAGSRQSRLLTEFVPSTAGQIRGFVIVDSTQPLVAQELFAGADAMSAVPGVPISEH